MNLRFGQIAVEAGYGEGIPRTTLTRAVLQYEVTPALLTFGQFKLTVHPELGAGIWRGDRRITDLSLTPILRFQQKNSSRFARPYLEAAVGFHYISDIQMRRRVFSTNFQFGDHLGLGLLFGRKRVLDLCYQFQHLSNASIKRPNSGINFHIVRLGYSF